MKLIYCIKSYNMKHLYEMKTINYFGLLLTMPSKYKFLSTDSNGKVWACTKQPYIHSNTNIWSNIWCIDYPDIDYIVIAQVDLEGLDWKETLMCV